MNKALALEKYKEACKRLHNAWQASQCEWDDDIRRRFTKQQWQPIEETMILLERQIQQTTDMAIQARQRCP